MARPDHRVSQPATMPFFERIGSPPWYLERVKTVGARHFRSLQMAIEEGVSIALGTDEFPFSPMTAPPPRFEKRSITWKPA